PPSPTQISTLSLHDALPIYGSRDRAVRVRLRGRAESMAENQPRGDEGDIRAVFHGASGRVRTCAGPRSCRKIPPIGMTGHCGIADRKSTRLNSSHLGISYAV